MKETGLIKYDAMCQAIAEAHHVDEVRDMRHKAHAVERYAQQAQNMEAERQARAIRLRAERRCGELLKEMMANGQRAKPGSAKQHLNNARTSSDSTNETTLSDLGITRHQSWKWQKLAEVPEEDFELGLSEPNPSTESILRKLNGGTDRMDPMAISLCGRIRDLDELALHEADLEEIVLEMFPSMWKDSKERLPRLIKLIERLEKIP